METVINQRNASPHGKRVQVKVSVDSEIAAAFKNACAASYVSMAAELARFMADYSNGTVKCTAAPDYSTRRRRRSFIRKIIGQLEQMKACEEKVRDRTPDNLQASSVYDATEEAIASLEEAIDALAAY